ncbi:MAG: tyrosine-type recombinase/integrase [Polyangiaceae bacterium]|nr:tyrosine-type recombinase/integrase [Polyangiaceae bacterium]
MYPDEDAKLVASDAVPLEYRVFYGFLHREGPRVNEAARLTWSDFDLDRGSVVLDVNKTNDPRAWALSPGVARALRAWRMLLADHGISTKDADFVFVDLDGERVNINHTAARYREHLVAAGIDRSVLFERTDTRQQIRAHDTRATFVTVSLANGKSEAWVQDRTGHKSSLMINRYRRAARTASELHLGDFTPLDAAIPELARQLTAEPATAKTPRFTDEPSLVIAPDLATETATPTRIVSGIVSNSGDDTPESDVESLMISASSPTRTRTGTTSRSRDFKFDKGDSSRRDPCDSAGSDDGSQRLDAAVAFTEPVCRLFRRHPGGLFRHVEVARRRCRR